MTTGCLCDGHTYRALLGMVLHHYSALVIFEALKAMQDRTHSGGIVLDVYLFGAPLSGKASEWEGLVQLISGRIVNCLSQHDWVLKLMVRGAGAEFCVAGLDGINSPRVTNLNLSPLVKGHGEWATHMPRIMRLVGLAQKKGGDLPRFGCVGRRVRRFLWFR